MRVADRLAAHRTGWHVGEVVAAAMETPLSRRIELEVPTWPGNEAGAHLDIRLTAPDGYQASRAYSLASSGPGTHVTLVVDRMEYGEVSPFLVDELAVGDRIELHGPLGAFFIWRPPMTGTAPAAPMPVQLIGAGSGVVPLFAMVDAHAHAGDATEFRLLYSVRDPEHVFFRAELEAAARDCPGPLRLDLLYTRQGPEGWPAPIGRITRERLAELAIPPADDPTIFLCGPTPFVEMVAMWLVELGHAPERIRAERFGGAA
ncbi:MAG: hypothetical protein J0G30_00395 [Actinomycetales bacterium]|nr:hypothetical protein [Actinomycetales bacterium]